MTIQGFLSQVAKRLDGVTVTFGFLCFNTREISIMCFAALAREAERLEALGAKVHIIIRDNGGDGTGKAIEAKFGEEIPIHVFNAGGNVGQSKGRNQLIAMALEIESHYLLFVDGDIQIVPLSAYQMVAYMRERPKLGCLSAHPVRQTTDPEIASKAIYHIENIQNDMTTACTGYAMFNCQMFSEGVSLETNGPFGVPGWGLEDDDLYLQMTHAGWEVFYFIGLVYLQVKLRSSWPSLFQAGVDIKGVFDARKKFFLEKWKAKGLDPAILLKVKAQEIEEYVPEPTDEALGYRVTRWGKFENLECIKCQYSTLWMEKMQKHLESGLHPWAYPGQYPRPVETDSNVPAY